MFYGISWLKKLLIDHKIWFQDIPTNNDIFYSFAVVLMSEKIIVCGKNLLQYRYRRSGSLTTRRFSGGNHTVDAFYALFRFVVQNNLGDRLIAILINLIADNLQLYLSGESYPLKIRMDSLKSLLGYKDMIDALKQYGEKNVLYPHNQEFVHRLIKGMDVCGIEYFQYYLYSVKEIIEERRKKGHTSCVMGMRTEWEKATAVFRMQQY